MPVHFVGFLICQMKEPHILTVNVIELLRFVLKNRKSYDPGVFSCKAYISIFKCVISFWTVYLLLKLWVLEFNYPYSLLNTFEHRAQITYPLHINLKSFSKSLFLRIVSAQLARKICRYCSNKAFFCSSISMQIVCSTQFTKCSRHLSQTCIFIVYNSHRNCSLWVM